MTPPIPEWMRNTRIEGYTNIYEMLPKESRIYGTESLFGDWSGRVLVLAQDFAPIDFVNARIAAGEEEPYRHNQNLQTNNRLFKQTALIRSSDRPRTCGVLYGSALAGLCKRDNAFRSPLPNRRVAIEYGAKVLKYVVSNMPNLRVIVGLGTVPNTMIANVFQPGCDWKSARDACESVSTNANIALVFASHPVSSTKRELVKRRWDLVANRLGDSKAA